MERVLLFVYTTALVVTLQLTTGNKLSLRLGPEQSEFLDGSQLKNCTMCPEHHKPVCASNGKTYPNPCFMACEVGANSAVGILYEGECRHEHRYDRVPYPTPEESTTESHQDHCLGICPPFQDPVCGSDGKWYQSPCLLDCNLATKVDDSKCPTTPINLQYEEHYNSSCTNCTKVYDPVCTTNGNWYYNPCMMLCMLGEYSGVEIRYHGKCINF